MQSACVRRTNPLCNISPKLGTLSHKRPGWRVVFRRACFAVASAQLGVAGTALEVLVTAMTKLLTASMIALVAILPAACGNGKADSAADPRTAAAVAGAPPSAPSNTTPLRPVTEAMVAPQAAANPQGAATLEFKKHIDAYLKIHNEAEAKVPNLKKTDDPKEIADREKALGETIMTLRAGAQPLEIFTAEYQPYFVKIVQDDFKTRSAADRKAIVSELPAKMKVDINTVYPTTIPLATFPPALLLKLPDLPPELEYRIVGRSLILRDVKANLIVDILRDVVPTIPS